MEPVNANIGAVTPKSHTAAKIAGVAAGIVAVGSLAYAAKRGGLSKDVVIKTVGEDGAKIAIKDTAKNVLGKIGDGYKKIGGSIKETGAKLVNFVKTKVAPKAKQTVEDAAK